MRVDALYLFFIIKMVKPVSAVQVHWVIKMMMMWFFLFVVAVAALLPESSSLISTLGSVVRVCELCRGTAMVLFKFLYGKKGQDPEQIFASGDC